MKYSVLMISETLGSRITPGSAELPVLAGHLSPSGVGQRFYLICGNDIAGRAGAFSAQTGCPAYVADSPDFQFPNPALTATITADLIKETAFDFICFLHTAAGCQAAAATAVKIGAGCVSGVCGVRVEEDGIFWQRSLFNGKLTMETMTTARPMVVTVLPGAFSRRQDDPAASTKPDITCLTVKQASKQYRPQALTAADDTDAAIDNADIIVAAGRGIGSEENLELVNRLARLLPNAAVAASRPLCDLKWLPYSRQVGATGKTVTPKLYLACGISGAQQHLYGMKDSQWIVAVNTDPNAAIFSVADFCIVEDVTAFLPALADLYEKKRENTSGN